MSETDKVIKVEAATHEALQKISESNSLPIKQVVGYLVDQCVKFNMLSPDWSEKLREQIRTETLEDVSDEKKMRNAIQLIQVKAVMSAKMKVFQTYIDSMEVEERKRFAEELMGIKTDDPAAFLDNLTAFQLFKINGERRFCRTGANGKPVIPLMHEADLTVCANGYHTAGGWCQCDLWRSCDLRLNEYALQQEKNPAWKKQLEDNRFKRLNERANK